MTLDQLYYFRKLAELQHYSKAASELYISQPSLSYSISKLEKELGVPLFRKNGRNVILTNYGKQLYECTVEVLTKLEDGVNMIKQSAAKASYKINIATLPIQSGNLISKNIKAFMEYYPNTIFDIITCVESKDVIQGINDGVFDIGFCFRTDNESDLSFIPIIEKELVVITAKEHELSNKSRLTLSDLANYPLITYRASNPLGNLIRDLFKEHNINPKIVFAFDEEITISEMVAQNLGVAILANLPVLRNYLSMIPLETDIDSPAFCLAYQRNTKPSKVTQKFIQLLISSSAIPVNT